MSATNNVAVELSAEEKTQLKAKFDEAAKQAPKLPVGVTSDEKLALYALFKQGTVGEITNDTPKPGFLDLTGKAKYNAWLKNKGMSAVTAQQKYIDLVASLDKKYATPTVTTE
ncbi:hypothetical protein IWW47_002263 [Coemansia sp. RSA 2052]|nr:hypothetical protein GGF38_005544 [Coemansia sp. RSA 25]KAJ2504986.1 hypothetical protein IWW47_002263 [Coemansia sp. RSA 2052]